MARFKTWRIGVLNKDSLLSVWCQFAMFQIANLSGDSLLGAELLLLFFCQNSFFRSFASRNFIVSGGSYENFLLNFIIPARIFKSFWWQKSGQRFWLKRTATRDMYILPTIYVKLVGRKVVVGR